MSVWSALFLFRLVLNSLFRLVLNCINARKKTECCIFISFVTNITKIANVLQNYIFLVGVNCGLTFVLSNFKNTQNEKEIYQRALFIIVLRGGCLVIYCITIFRNIN